MALSHQEPAPTGTSGELDRSEHQPDEGRVGRQHTEEQVARLGTHVCAQRTDLLV